MTEGGRIGGGSSVNPNLGASLRKGWFRMIGSAGIVLADLFSTRSRLVPHRIGDSLADHRGLE